MPHAGGKAKQGKANSLLCDAANRGPRDDEVAPCDTRRSRTHQLTHNNNKHRQPPQQVRM